MDSKTILLALTSLFLFTSCVGKNKQCKEELLLNEKPQTQAVDTSKIYDMSEVDTLPVMP